MSSKFCEIEISTNENSNNMIDFEDTGLHTNLILIDEKNPSLASITNYHFFDDLLFQEEGGRR